MLEFQKKAIDAVATAEDAPLEHFYVVWFCKTLQNWKALVSTDVVDGRYWEVTHNGNKDETYVDTYVKESNKVLTGVTDDWGPHPTRNTDNENGS